MTVQSSSEHSNDRARVGTANLLPQVWGAVGVVFITLAFVISRALYYMKGVRFDTSTIDYFAQLLDRTLLRRRLAESIYYLHSQPPFYNLLTGVALKLAPKRPELLLWPAFMAAGLYAALCLDFITVKLRVPRLVAAVLTAAIAVSPGFVLYENWYFYPHLDVALLVGALAWLCRSGGCPGRSLLIAAAHLVCLSLTRSLFHPIYYALAALVTTALAGPGARRGAFVCFAVPGFLLLLWCTKNLLLFGFFGTSSWGSRNFSQGVGNVLGAERVQVEASLGHLSPAASLAPFDSGDQLIKTLGLQDHKTGVPALDNVQKANSEPNYNHWSYPPSARFYAADTKHLLAQFPHSYLKGIVKKSVPLFFNAIEDGYVAPNRAHIVKAADEFDAVDQSKRAHWFLAIGVVLAAAGVPWVERSRRLVLALCFLSIGWVAAVGILGDFGENYRFRYDALWLGWVVAVSGYFAAGRAALLAFQESRRALFAFQESRRALR